MLVIISESELKSNIFPTKQNNLIRGAVIKLFLIRDNHENEPFLFQHYSIYWLPMADLESLLHALNSTSHWDVWKYIHNIFLQRCMKTASGSKKQLVFSYSSSISFLYKFYFWVSEVSRKVIKSHMQESALHRKLLLTGYMNCICTQPAQK